MPTLHVQAGSTDDLQDIADYLWKARKIVVITGAGISTNSGIPVSCLWNVLCGLVDLIFFLMAIANAHTRTFDLRMACIP